MCRRLRALWAMRRWVEAQLAAADQAFPSRLDQEEINVRVSERLVVKLRLLEGQVTDRGVFPALPAGVVLARTNSSLSSRVNGAWSWFAMTPDYRELHIGSQVPMGVLLRHWGEVSVSRDGFGLQDDWHLDLPAGLV